jgi:hypothetical protein
LLHFPIVTRSASSPRVLYEIAFNISIYSSHVGRVLENSVPFVFGTNRPNVHTAPNVLARQATMYLANVAFGLTYTEIGAMFWRDRTTVAHACAVIEDLRDDPRVDRALAALEWVLTTSRREIHQADHIK